MTNRNEYLRHLDLTNSDTTPVQVKFRDTRSDAQKKAEKSRVQLAARIAAHEADRAKGHDRTGTLRGIWIRMGGSL